MLDFILLSTYYLQTNWASILLAENKSILRLSKEKRKKNQKKERNHCKGKHNQHVYFERRFFKDQQPTHLQAWESPAIMNAVNERVRKVEKQLCSWRWQQWARVREPHRPGGSCGPSHCPSAAIPTPASDGFGQGSAGTPLQTLCHKSREIVIIFPWAPISGKFMAFPTSFLYTNLKQGCLLNHLIIS